MSKVKREAVVLGPTLYLIFPAIVIKSVTFNFTLAVNSPKLNHAKNHFLSHHNVFKINKFAKFLTSDLLSNG